MVPLLHSISLVEIAMSGTFVFIVHGIIDIFTLAPCLAFTTKLTHLPPSILTWVTLVSFLWLDLIIPEQLEHRRKTTIKYEKV